MLPFFNREPVFDIRLSGPKAQFYHVLFFFLMPWEGFIEPVRNGPGTTLTSTHMISLKRKHGSRD